MLNNHINLSRDTEQVHLRQQLSSQWGETQSWHCFSFVKQLSKVVASTVSKLGQELITKHSWHRAAPASTGVGPPSPVGILFFVRVCLTKIQSMSRIVHSHMTVGARLIDKCTNNFADKFNRAK